MQSKDTPDNLFQMKQDTEELQSLFKTMGAVATEALKGIGAAATLAAQNVQALQTILKNATDSALAGSTKKSTALHQSNALDLKEITTNEQQKLDTQVRYQSLGLQEAEKGSVAKKRIIDTEFSEAKKGADALMQLADLVTENGKKNNDLQKAAALVKIGVDTARAISSLVAAANENPANAATSGIAGAIQFATGIAEIAANIAKAKEILSGGGDASGSGSGSAPSLGSPASGIQTGAPVLNPATPSNNGVTIDRTTRSNTTQTGIIKAYVVETEITKAQQRAAGLRRQSMH